LRVSDARDAVGRVAALLADDAARARMGQAGLAFAAAHTGATRRTMALVEGLVSAPR
jgi:3-deoxy-D-manno-octulosonic-acid transferase